MYSVNANTSTKIGLSFTLATIVTIIMAYSSELQSFHQLWVDSYTYTHGYLTLAISLYLLSKLPMRQILLTAKPNVFILFSLLLAIFAMLVASAGDIKTLQLLLLPILFLLSLGTYFGWKNTKLMTFPVLLLLFAAPIWDDFSPLFQIITVSVNQFLLWVFDIPAQIQGLYITLPVGTFFVAGGCSGVKYILVGLFLSSVYSYLFLTTIKQKVTLILISLALSMFSNWVRVFGIIIAGYWTDMESPLVKDHEWWGWVIFTLFTLLPLYFISHKIESRNTTTKADKRHPEQKETTTTIRLVTVPFIVIFILSLPALLLHSDETPATATTIQPPLKQSNWLGPLFEKTPWGPYFIEPDTHISSGYIKNGNKVHLDLIHYQHQSQGKELIYFKNKNFNDDMFSLVQTSDIDTGLQTGSVKQLILENDKGEGVVVWYWYLINGKAYTHPLKAKLAGSINRIFGNRAGSWISVSTQCDIQSNCIKGIDRLRSYLDTYTEYLKNPGQPDNNT